MKTIYLKEVDSTNTYLKTHYKTLDHMTWLSTDHQTKGKGRSNRVWFGDKNSLMCSVLLKKELKKQWTPILPLLAAKSLHEVLSTYHQDIYIKWPNDLLINQLKLSGILVESIIESNDILAVVIGFGININNMSFKDDIKDIATSISLETSKTFDKTDIYKKLINQFEKDYTQFIQNQTFVINYCNDHLAFKNQMISYKDNHNHHQALIIHIDEHGHLIVEENNEQTALYSGEISIVKT